MRTATPVQDINIIGTYNVSGSPCESLYYHAGKYHGESSVAYTWDHFRLKENVVNLMLQLYTSWSFRHVTFQKPDSANFPEIVAFQKNIVSAKNLFEMFFLV